MIFQYPQHAHTRRHGPRGYSNYRSYKQAGDTDLARRSRISAASCFWRAGDADRAQTVFDALISEAPDQAGEIDDLVKDLEKNSA